MAKLEDWMTAVEPYTVDDTASKAGAIAVRAWDYFYSHINKGLIGVFLGGKIRKIFEDIFGPDPYQTKT
jgi:hypothetical protein